MGENKKVWNIEQKNLDERSQEGWQGSPDVLQGRASVIVQVPQDEPGQVAQEGAHVQL